MRHGRLSRLDRTTLAPVLLVGVALLAAWLLYPSPRKSTEREGITEIVYWTPPGVPNDSAKIVVEEFERRYPQYDVLLGTATVRDASSDPTRLLLGVAGEVPPDVVLFDRFAIVEWASRGAFTDLNPFIAASTSEDPIREENYFPPAWRESIYKGSNYAIPMDADTRALFYNVNSLIRAGFVYTADDPLVKSGQVRAGDARPPRTWEEILTKRVHAAGNVTPDGLVTVRDYRRRPFLNDGIPEGVTPDLRVLNVRAGDVVVLTKGGAIFRARVREVLSDTQLSLDLQRELPRGKNVVPGDFASDADIKIFDQDGYAVRLSRFDPDTGILTEAGFIPTLGNSFLYLFGWQNGGEFMSEDGTRVTLDDPRIIGALQWIVDVFDSMGGIEMVNYVQSNQKRGGPVSRVMDPFISERLALRVDIDYLLRDIMRLRPDLHIGVTAAPLPQSQIDAGVQPFGWGGGWAYAIPSTSKNKEAAWFFIEWLASLEANQILADYEASLFRSRGEKFIPRLHADKRLMQWQIEKYIDDSGELPSNIKEAYHRFASLMPTSRFRPVTPIGQKLWTEHLYATDMAVNHLDTPYEALTDRTRLAQTALDNVLNPPHGTPVNWRVLIAIYVAAIVLLFAGLILRQEHRRKLHGGGRRKWIDGYIAASPWLLGFLVFGAGPILFSVVISFCHYDVINPAEFVGLHNYRQLMGTEYDPLLGRETANDPYFYSSLLHTLYMVISVPLHIVIGLAIAMLLDTRVRGLSWYRAIYYLPAIVPPMAAFILWVWLFDPGRGMINNLLIDLGMRNPPKWLDDAAWAKPSLILMGLWSVGASMIIWLAGLKDIPQAYYEAAAVDGANWFQRFFRITLPLLTPYILFNLIIGLIGVFQIFEPAYIMTDGGPAGATYFFAYKLFMEAFRFLNMGVASAMAWILFIVVLLITLFQLWFSRKWVHYGA